MKIQKAGLPFNKEWYEILESSKEEVKNEWLRTIGYNSDYLEKRFGVKLNRNNLDDLVFIPIPCYKLKTNSILSIKTSKQVKDSLILCKDNAYFFVLKDTVLTFAIWFNYKNKKWRSKEWDSASETISKRFTEYYLKQNIPFIDFQIPYT